MSKNLKIISLIICLLSSFILGGCTSDLDADNFTSYNNAVVDMYQRYIDQTNKTYTALGKETDAQKIVSLLNKAKKDTQVYYDSFKIIPASQESQDLAKAFSNVYETELRGLDNLTSIYSKVQGDPEKNPNVPAAIQKYEQDDQAAIDNFIKVQKTLAQKYNVKLK